MREPICWWANGTIRKINNARKYTILTCLGCATLPVLLQAPVHAAETSPAASQTVRFTIDAGRNVVPISRYIYGVNAPLGGQYSNLTLRRAGGNRWTALQLGQQRLQCRQRLVLSE